MNDKNWIPIRKSMIQDADELIEKIQSNGLTNLSLEDRLEIFYVTDLLTGYMKDLKQIQSLEWLAKGDEVFKPDPERVIRLIRMNRMLIQDWLDENEAI